LVGGGAVGFEASVDGTKVVGNRVAGTRRDTVSVTTVDTVGVSVNGESGDDSDEDGNEGDEGRRAHLFL